MLGKRENGSNLNSELEDIESFEELSDICLDIPCPV